MTIHVHVFIDERESFKKTKGNLLSRRPVSQYSHVDVGFLFFHSFFLSLPRSGLQDFILSSSLPPSSLSSCSSADYHQGLDKLHTAQDRDQIDLLSILEDVMTYSFTIFNGCMQPLALPLKITCHACICYATNTCLHVLY